MDGEVGHGDDTQSKDLGAQILLQEHQGSHKNHLSEHVHALVPVQALAVIVKEEHVSDFHRLVLQFVLIPVELSKDLERDANDVESDKGVPKLDCRVVFCGVALNG